MDEAGRWQRFQEHYYIDPKLGLSLDVSRMGFDGGFIDGMSTGIARALEAMAELEAGAIANPDEGRRVGHYWLRAPERAPEQETTDAIEAAQGSVRRFAAEVHSGAVAPEPGRPFTDLLLIGIGGSALGPQLLADALGDPDRDRLAVHFFDNTDPDGMDRVLRALDDRLRTTLCLVISKSGGTKETRNGLEIAREAMESRGLAFPPRAVAVTGEGSALDRRAREEGWLARFPMWDWVGGRTSITSAVGLLPAALQGLDTEALLRGASVCDEATRERDPRRNPAALLALSWFHATGGRGERDMVVLPYKDRLLLFSRYLQQLVMESLGKDRDLDGEPVAQGIAVYGNKGSTDQHAYVQQLRDGVENFFVTFLQVLEDGGSPLEVEPGITAGDYLRGFLLGTRQALTEKGRRSMTLTIPRVDAFSIGALIALYERAVGLYANLVNINAYHQPGVEAGKVAAGRILELQKALLETLAQAGTPRTAEELADALGAPEAAETVFHLLVALEANRRGIRRAGGSTPADTRWTADPEPT